MFKKAKELNLSRSSGPGKERGDNLKARRAQARGDCHSRGECGHGRDAGEAGEEGRQETGQPRDNRTD